MRHRCLKRPELAGVKKGVVCFTIFFSWDLFSWDYVLELLLVCLFVCLFVFSLIFFCLKFRSFSIQFFICFIFRPLFSPKFLQSRSGFLWHPKNEAEKTPCRYPRNEMITFPDGKTSWKHPWLSSLVNLRILNNFVSSFQVFFFWEK